MIKEFCEYIEDNTSFTIGTDLFAASLDSDTPDDCILIEEDAPGLVDDLLSDFRQVPLTVYSRNLKRFTARDNAYTLFNLLVGAAQIDLPEVASGGVYSCNVSCSTPAYIGLDETKRRYVYSMPIVVIVSNLI